MKSPLFEQITIIGQGVWGRALGKVLEQNGFAPSFIDVKTPEVERQQLLRGKTLVVLATPFRVTEETLLTLKGRPLAGVINASKGIDRHTLKTFSGMAKKILKVPFASLSGPTFAQEVAEGRPTACVLAGFSRSFVKTIAPVFSTKTFRIYTSFDPLGVEVCGALKNVLAIACGISDGCHLGLNARAALLARGLKEMETLVRYFGGQSPTVYGLAGVGDLWLTATGDLSRNRRYGLLVAQGRGTESAELSAGGPVEGLYTVLQVHVLAKRMRVELPICEQVYKIVTGAATPQGALESLMTRDLKSEAASFVKRHQTASSKRRLRP